MYCAEIEIAKGHIEIAFIGYNPCVTRELFKRFVDDNRKQLKRVCIANGTTEFSALFDNGDVIRTWGTCNEHKRGRRVDQILIAGDDEKQIYSKRYKDIAWIQTQCMCATCIPEEFRMMYMYY